MTSASEFGQYLVNICFALGGRHGFPFNPLEVKLVAGDLRTAQILRVMSYGTASCMACVVSFMAFMVCVCVCVCGWWGWYGWCSWCGCQSLCCFLCCGGGG